MQKAIVCAAGILLSCTAIAQTPGINLANIDSSVSPRNDIYKYANGKWLKTQQIPASDGSWGSFNEINERNVANLRSLLEAASKDAAAPAGSKRQRLRDFYLLAMDSTKADKEGIKPIAADMAMIDAIKTKQDLLRT